MFQKSDRKLTKNLYKRCIVDPLAERLLFRQHHVELSTVPDAKPVTELEAYHSDDQETMSKLHKLVKLLARQHAQLSATLKDNLVQPMQNYRGLLEGRKDVDEQLSTVNELLQKCELVDDAFDYYSKDGILSFFKNKQLFKVDRYLIVVNGLLLKLVPSEESLALNKKYIKQVFAGDVNTPLKLVKDILLWLIEKFKYDYTED